MKIPCNSAGGTTSLDRFNSINLMFRMDSHVLKLYAHFNKVGDESQLCVADFWLTLSQTENISISETYDLFFTRLAYLYDEGSVSWDFGDILVNQAYAEWIFEYQDKNEKLVDFPSKFWEVYLAFDEGEYHFESDPNYDPVREKTDPMIKAFLAKNLQQT